MTMAAILWAIRRPSKGEAVLSRHGARRLAHIAGVRSHHSIAAAEPMKVMQLATLFLGRSAIGGDAQAAGLAHIGSFFALGDAFRCFGVEQLRFRGATAHDRKGLNHHGALVETGAHLNLVTDMRFFARLATLAPAVDFATFYSRLGQRPGFIETGSPQPFVQANFVVFV